MILKPEVRSETLEQNTRIKTTYRFVPDSNNENKEDVIKYTPTRGKEFKITHLLKQQTRS